VGTVGSGGVRFFSSYSAVKLSMQEWRWLMSDARQLLKADFVLDYSAGPVSGRCEAIRHHARTDARLPQPRRLPHVHAVLLLQHLDKHSSLLTPFPNPHRHTPTQSHACDSPPNQSPLRCRRRVTKAHLVVHDPK
jgi:hypothetical protein